MLLFPFMELDRRPHRRERHPAVEVVPKPVDDGGKPLHADEFAVVGPQPLHQFRERLGLPLRLRAVGSAEQRLEPAVLRELVEPLVDDAPPEVAPGAVADRLHVVEQDLPRRPAEVLDRVEYAVHQRVLRAVDRQLDVLHPREAHHHQEYVHRVGFAVGVDEFHLLLPVDLGLHARQGLEPHRRLADPFLAVFPAEFLEYRRAALVASLPDEVEDGRDRARYLQLFDYLVLERVQFGWDGRPRRPALPAAFDSFERGLRGPVIAAALLRDFGEVRLEIRDFFFRNHVINPF